MSRSQDAPPHAVPGAHAVVVDAMQPIAELDPAVRRRGDPGAYRGPKPERLHHFWQARWRRAGGLGAMRACQRRFVASWLASDQARSRLKGSGWGSMATVVSSCSASWVAVAWAWSTRRWISS